jgi:acyl dehydratase
LAGVITGDGMEQLYLEDLHEGQRFVGPSRQITADEIKAFAAAFDPQPFHLDEATAAGTFFDGLAASGWHTAALTMRLLVDTMPLAGGLIGAGGELSWPRPTRPGDVLHLECTIEKITPSRSRPDRGMIRVRSETRNQDGEVAQLFVVNMLAFRRPT